MAATKTFGDIGVDYGDDNYSYIGGNMADRWVVNTPWNTVNSFSTAEGGASGASVPTITEDVNFSDTSFSGDVTIDVAAFMKSIAMESSITGGTDDYTGTLIDAGFTVTVGGNIIIPNRASVLTSTGIWIQTETGNIENPTGSNKFRNLEIAKTGKTTTMTGGVLCEMLDIGPGVLTGVDAFKDLSVVAFANDFLTIDSNATITNRLISCFIGADRTQKAITCAGMTAVFRKIGSSKLTMTGNLIIVNSDFQVYVDTFDLNDNNLTVKDIELGFDAGNIDFLCGDGIITCVDINKTAGAIGILNLMLEGSAFNCSGDIDFTDITVTPGTAIINLTNTVTKTLIGDDQTLYDLVKSGVGITEIADNFNVNSLLGSAGTIRSDVADTQRIITATNTRVVTGMIFKDISMGSAGRVNAKAATNTNNGNNLGIVFVDTLSPSLMGF